jgi:hypothetical protein
MNKKLFPAVLLFIFLYSFVSLSAQEYVDSQGRTAECTMNQFSLIVNQGNQVKVFSPSPAGQTFTWISTDGWSAYYAPSSIMLSYGNFSDTFFVSSAYNNQSSQFQNQQQSSGRSRAEIQYDIDKTQDLLDDCIRYKKECEDSGNFVTAIGYSSTISDCRNRLYKLRDEYAKADH